MKSDSPKTKTSKTPTDERRPGLPVPLGRLVATPGALAALTREEMLTAVGRHASGDLGDCGSEDAAENDFALDKYLRLFSVYHSAAGVKFWVITEADRSATTVLLPEDY
jgi:hypothetical protein